ncbi:cupredoxin family protein [[Pseudomonas] carboxydohydrogena]
MNTFHRAGAACFVAMISPSAWAAGAGGHHHHAEYSAGEPGDARKAARVVHVTMTEANGKMIYAPDRIEVRKGEQIKFVLRNNGDLDHEFLLASTSDNLKHADAMAKNPDMTHDDPNGKRLPPRKAAEIVWKFTRRGTFEYSCLIPGHREAGMVGTVIVK